MQKQVDGLVEQKAFDVATKAIADRITALEHADDASLAEALHQVHDLESKIVSRDENVVHWAATDALALRVNTLSDKMCAPK